MDKPLAHEYFPIRLSEQAKDILKTIKAETTPTDGTYKFTASIEFSVETSRYGIDSYTIENLVL